MKKHYQGAAHIAVRTADLKTSIAFYEKIGGEVIAEDLLETADGPQPMALVSFAGYVLELIRPAIVPELSDGCIPHFAVYVDDVDEAAKDLEELGIHTFMTPEKKVLPTLFGGLENRFFRGPSGEQIELLKMYK
ncbi:MAG: VOC family protein [Lachnospiraceae bacterium]|nr:VOC family protein [Lachnospiraceae bacterium]